MIAAFWAGMGLWRLAVYAAVVAALVASGYALVDHIGDVREVEVVARYEAAIAKLKTAAATELAKQTGLTLKAEHELGALRAIVEIQDAKNRQTVAGLERRLADAAATHGGRLRDPNATGCRGSSGSSASPAVAGAVDRPADPAEGTGLFSAGATELLERLTSEADEINLAYASCRADSMNLRASSSTTERTSP